MRVSLFLIVSALTLSACQAGKHSIISSTSGAITVAYPGYKMTPTLTKNAQKLAKKHCSKYHKVASYSGARIPNPLSTMEWHDFQCIEKTVSVSQVNYDVNQALNTETVVRKISTYLECVRGSIVLLDDLVSDAATIAVAISDVCSQFHDSYVREILSSIEYSSRIKSIIRESITESAGIKVIPYVLRWRRIIRNGFNRTEKPSKKELPNNLYSASVKISI